MPGRKLALNSANSLSLSWKRLTSRLGCNTGFRRSAHLLSRPIFGRFHRHSVGDPRKCGAWCRNGRFSVNRSQIMPRSAALGERPWRGRLRGYSSAFKGYTCNSLAGWRRD